MLKKKKQTQEEDAGWDEALAESEAAEGLDDEGQLSVDIYQDKNNIVIKSTIAGVEPEDIDITFDNDMITVRGSRQKDTSIDDEDYFYQECYWGSFSRSIILPVAVQQDKIEASIKNGILTIILPKAKHAGDNKIEVKDDN